MLYTPEQAERLHQECDSLLHGLDMLMVACTAQGSASLVPRVRDFMLHGASRRVAILKRSVENIYNLFPLDAVIPLPRNTVADAQINLHAFVINLYGVFDTWAWSFILRHDLEGTVRGRMKIGVFKPETQALLPPPLRDYLALQQTKDWFQNYLKEYRDALAHRIPLYIPPSAFTPDDTRRSEALQQEKMQSIAAHSWERLDAIYAEEVAIGQPCYAFLHSFGDSPNDRPVALHPQLICDGKLVLEFGEMFLKHWHEKA